MFAYITKNGINASFLNDDSDDNDKIWHLAARWRPARDCKLKRHRADGRGGKQEDADRNEARKSRQLPHEAPESNPSQETKTKEDRKVAEADRATEKRQREAAKAIRESDLSDRKGLQSRICLWEIVWGKSKQVIYKKTLKQQPVQMSKGACKIQLD